MVPKLTAGTRYLREQLSAYGVKVSLSEGCLQNFVCHASEAVVRTQRRGESYISCLRRHLDARARFILLWTHGARDLGVPIHSRRQAGQRIRALRPRRGFAGVACAG